MSGSHQVVISGEEQLKIFTLPSLKALHKYKLTAREGSKIRKVGFVGYRSRSGECLDISAVLSVDEAFVSDENYVENDLTVLSNQGDLYVFTVPNLRQQMKQPCIPVTNVA